ncbi:MAG TPA: hypothetical protein VFG48_04300 [Xanthomonadales bacterium]|nr:hypothetical protein [Xanthomonadales bacterium]
MSLFEALKRRNVFRVGMAYLVACWLLQAVPDCLCGAPFDLDATPGFAELPVDSPLCWPPRKPLDFPQKEW